MSTVRDVVLLQQLAGATAEAEALKAERDQLAEVLLEMQVSG